MNAIKLARKTISSDPTSDAARTLAKLVLALESETSFQVATLYELDMKTFELAMEVLNDWRLDRYYEGKAKLFDMSHQVHHLSIP